MTAPPATDGRVIGPQMLPQDIDAEKGLLGSALLDPAALEIAVAVPTGAFVGPDHRTVHRVLRELHEAGRPADLIVFRDECERLRLDLKAADVAVELANSVPSAVNAGHYAEIVTRRHRQRQLLLLADRIKTKATAADADPEALTVEIENDLRAMGDGVSGNTALQLFTAHEIKNRPRIKWLIGGIIPAGSLAVLYGPSGGNKTFIALDWACSIAAGCRWADHYVEPGRVLYVAAEGSGGLGKRLRAWESERGIVPEQLFFVRQTVPLLGPSSADVLLHAMKPIDPSPSVVFVDTVARAMPGAEENSAKDMGLFVAAVDRIRQALGCAVVAVHHTGKNPDAAERGSSALRGAADTMIRVLPDGDMFALSCDKQKDAGPFPDLSFTRETVDIGDGEKSCVIRTATDVGSNFTAAMRTAYDAAKLLSPGESFCSSAWMKASGLPDRSFYRAKKALITQKFIVEVPKGKSIRYAANPELLPSCQTTANPTLALAQQLLPNATPPKGVAVAVGGVTANDGSEADDGKPEHVEERPPVRLAAQQDDADDRPAPAGIPKGVSAKSKKGRVTV